MQNQGIIELYLSYKGIRRQETNTYGIWDVNLGSLHHQMRYNCYQANPGSYQANTIMPYA